MEALTLLRLVAFNMEVSKRKLKSAQKVNGIVLVAVDTFGCQIMAKWNRKTKMKW